MTTNGMASAVEQSDATDAVKAVIEIVQKCAPDVAVTPGNVAKVLRGVIDAASNVYVTERALRAALKAVL